MENGLKVRVITESEMTRNEDNFSSYEKDDLRRLFGKKGLVVNLKRGEYFNIDCNGELLKDREGYDMWFSNKYIRVLEEDVKVGDKVFVDPDISFDKIYNELTVARDMVELAGKEVEIISIESGIFKIKELPTKLWEREMFVTKKQLEAKSKLAPKKVNSLEMNTKVIINPNLVSKKKYGSKTFTSEMAHYLGAITTIEGSIKKNDIIDYYLKVDSGSYQWSREMLISLEDYDDVLNIDRFSKQRIAIKLENKEDIKSFLTMLKDLKIKWFDDEEINVEGIEEDSLIITFFNKEDEEVKISTESQEYFDENQFKTIILSRLFIPELDKIKIKEVVNKSSKNITYDFLTNNIGIYSGDLYYKDDRDFSGWYLITKDFSVGLNCKRVGAWSLPYEDLKDKTMRKYISVNIENMNEYQNCLSQFMRTFDETLLEDFIKVLY